MRSAWLRYLLAIFYILAGFNHFRDPGFYLGLIPEYLPWPDLINTLSGIAEIILGAGVLLPPTRRVSGWLLIAMLIAFIPSHVYFIQIEGCVEGGLCVPLWVAWVRLLVIHPLLIVWAWYSCISQKGSGRHV